MAQRPLVAVTTTIDRHGGSHQQPSVFLYTSYLTSLARVGLAPVLLTPAHSKDDISAILGACAGVVLTGGEDVDPARFGEAPSPALGSVERARDEMEWRVLDVALERQLPVLGICRGMQVLNVYFGGSLYQDLYTERPGDIHHQQSEEWGRRSHYVAVHPETTLCEIIGSDRIFINSFHHQGVDRLGSGLRESARADDGLIEAFEAVAHPWLIGVQWHPERHEATAPNTDPDRRLFEALRRVLNGHG